MVQENEVVMIVLGLGVLLFILGNRSQLKRIESSATLILGFCFLLLGWALTVLEGFCWEVLLNYLEHMCYAAGSASLAAWCCTLFGRSKEVG